MQSVRLNASLNGKKVQFMIVCSREPVRQMPPSVSAHVVKSPTYLDIVGPLEEIRLSSRRNDRRTSAIRTCAKKNDAVRSS
jgi:hypothetical protein